MEWATLIPVATLILGALLTYLTEGRREAKRDRRAERVRLAIRTQERMDRRDAFELEELNKLRDCIDELVHLLTTVDLVRAQRRGHIKNVPLPVPEHIEQERALAVRRLRAHTATTLDDDIRASAKRTEQGMMREYWELDRADPRELDMHDQADETLGLIGERIRTLYGREDAAS